MRAAALQCRPTPAVSLMCTPPDKEQSPAVAVMLRTPVALSPPCLWPGLFRPAAVSLSRHPSDIEDKLEAIYRSVSNTVASTLSSMNAAIQRKVSWFDKIKNTSFEHTKRFPEVGRSSDSIRLISMAYTNLSTVYSSYRRMRDIDGEIRVFYEKFSGAHKDPGRVGEAYGMFSDMSEFRLRMYKHNNISLNKIEKAELDFVVFLLSIDLIENMEMAGAVGGIVKSEEEKDRITKIVKANALSKTRAKTKQGAECERMAADDGLMIRKAGTDSAVQASPEYIEEICRIFRHYVNRDVLGLSDKVIAGIKSRIRNKVATDYSSVIRDMEALPGSDITCIAEGKDVINYYNGVLKEHFRVANFSDPGEVLKALEFEERYVAANSANFVNATQLMDTSALIDAYCTMTFEKISGWMQNIKHKIIESFLARDSIPATDEESKFISLDFVNLLELIRNQLEPLRFKKALYRKVRNHIVGEASLLRDDLVSVMEGEFGDAIKLRGKPGYEEYVIMVGNSGLKLAQYADDQNDLREIFIQILKSSNLLLSRFILETCSVIVDTIFTGEWYSSNVTYKLVATVEDFLNDYQVRMFEYTFYTFIISVIRSLISSYVKQLMRKRAQIHEDCSHRLKSDYEDLLRLFAKFVDHDDVEKRMEPLKFIIPILEAGTADLFVVETKALKIRYPDLPKNFVKSIVKKREDMDEKDKQDIRRHLREIFGNERSEKGTLFSKLFS
ncbi:UNVERIFIED_CONTAM: hypothetical protein PYX00_011504 [Menopon gallinae]|uniref:Exocyst complex component Sec6 n=1 Tax=Menopon gallinae TaxID=328185 RepID=A0AAW2H7V1_9NEOP